MAETLEPTLAAAQARIAAVREAVRALYATGTLHNHARMWLASCVVHVRKVHWRAGADWLYGHLLDGDLASNHLGWQWVAGTGSRKPYLFNADNVARYAPASWRSPGSAIDTSYEALDRLARQPAGQPFVQRDTPLVGTSQVEPRLATEPPEDLGLTAPDAAAAADRDVWLVHPWSLGELPAVLPADTVVIGVFLADFHRAWPWSERRWRFVGSRMAELAAVRWHGGAAAIGAALKGPVACAPSPNRIWRPGWPAGPSARRRRPCFRRSLGAVIPSRSRGPVPREAWHPLRTCQR